MQLSRPDGFVTGLPNCGVTAVAVAVGKSYQEVWDWFARNRKRPGAWKGRTSRNEYAPALLHFGAKKVKLMTAGCGLNVAKWHEMHTLPDTTYLVRVSGHMFVVRNSEVLDNVRHEWIEKSYLSRRIVKDYWIVET